LATKKIRVYELARELGVDNQVVLDLSEELKIGVKSHSSSIDDPSADRVRRLADSRGLKGEPIVDEPKPKPEPKKTTGRGKPKATEPVAEAPSVETDAAPKVAPESESEPAPEPVPARPSRVIARPVASRSRSPRPRRPRRQHPRARRQLRSHLRPRRRPRLR
jgi:translation initiation factor IF-2